MAAKAVSHPLRAQLLDLYGYGGLRSEYGYSPSQLANAWGLNLQLVAYHTQRLHEFGLLETVRVTGRGPAREHFYRATAHIRIEIRERTYT